MSKVKSNYEIISDKTQNPVVDSAYVKHGTGWLDTVVNQATSALSNKADKTYVDAQIATKANSSDVSALQITVQSKADSSTVSTLSGRVTDVETEQDTLSARMDTFTTLTEGSTTGDAELADAHVGVDGKTYTNVGGAIRGQVNDLKSDLNKRISNGKNVLNPSTVVNGYLSSQGVITYGSQNDWVNNEPIEIPSGYNYIVFSFLGQNAQNTFNIGRLAFYDEDMEKLSVEMTSSYKFTIPSGAKYLHFMTGADGSTLISNNKVMAEFSNSQTFSSFIAFGYVFNGIINEYENKFDSINDDIDEIESDVVQVKSDIGNLKVNQNAIVDGKYIISATGEIATHTSFGYVKFDVYALRGALIVPSTKLSAGSGAGGAFYSSDNSYISGLTSNQLISGNSFKVPVNASYFCISYSKSLGASSDVSLKILNLCNLIVDGVKSTEKTNYIDVYNGDSLVDVVESITDSSEINKYVINLHEGRYETVVESKIGENYKGLIIPDYVSILGIGNRNDIIISGKLPSLDYGVYANLISTINLTMNGTVENVTIYAKNIRYCNHDDGSAFGMIKSDHSFKSVVFYYDTPDSSIASSLGGCCAGIGGQVDKSVEFKNCVFTAKKSGGASILIHDNGNGSQLRGCRLYVDGCVFKDGSTSIDIMLSNSAGEHNCFAEVTGCLMQNGVMFATASSSIRTNKWELMATNNKNFAISKNSTLSDVDLTSFITEFNNIAVS